MFSFWDSVAELRQIEVVILVLVIVAPALCGTVLFSVRHRIRVLLSRSNQSTVFTYEENAQKLKILKQNLDSDLTTTRRELSSLRRATAPRQFTEAQENLLVGQLRGIKASPVIVSAYAFEDESANYAGQLAAALRKAGWETRVNKASMNDFKGVTVGVINLSRRPVSGQRELSEALRSAQVDVHQRDIPPDSIAGPMEDGSLLLVVGRK